MEIKSTFYLKTDSLKCKLSGSEEYIMNIAEQLFSNIKNEFIGFNVECDISNYDKQSVQNSTDRLLEKIKTGKSDEDGENGC